MALLSVHRALSLASARNLAPLILVEEIIGWVLSLLK